MKQATRVPVKGPFALREVASPWSGTAEMSCLLESPEAEQELGPSCEAVIKSSLEPWGGGCKDLLRRLRQRLEASISSAGLLTAGVDDEWAA